jgi:hypothetical protein
LKAKKVNSTDDLFWFGKFFSADEAINYFKEGAFILKLVQKLSVIVTFQFRV